MACIFEVEAWFHRGVTLETIAQARPFLTRARALDPRMSTLIVSDAAACALELRFGPSLLILLRCLLPQKLRRRAVAVAPDYAEGLRYAIGLVLTFTKRSAQGVAAFGPGRWR